MNGALTYEERRWRDVYRRQRIEELYGEEGYLLSRLGAAAQSDDSAALPRIKARLGVLRGVIANKRADGAAL